jgi:hypothetical protein
LFGGSVFIVFGDDEEIGPDAEEVFLEVEAFLVAVGDDDFVDHAEALEEDAFVIVRDGGFAAFVVPEDFCGGEGDDEVVTECACFFEELEVASVEDVVAAGDEDFFHRC